jgi:hypothetical protein
VLFAQVVFSKRPATQRKYFRKSSSEALHSKMSRTCWVGASSSNLISWTISLICSLDFSLANISATRSQCQTGFASKLTGYKIKLIGCNQRKHSAPPFFRAKPRWHFGHSKNEMPSGEASATSSVVSQRRQRGWLSDWIFTMFRPPGLVINPKSIRTNGLRNRQYRRQFWKAQSDRVLSYSERVAFHSPTPCSSRYVPVMVLP